MMHDNKLNCLLRLSQFGVALIPVAIGFLALLNNLTGFHGTIEAVIKPLITMQGNASQSWRALPVWLAPATYTFMLIAEFLVGIFSLIGLIFMIKNSCKDAIIFEKSKAGVYLACGWGIMVWGLGFFEGGGDWFLTWQNNSLASFQGDALKYVLLLLAVFIYLKLSKE